MFQKELAEKIMQSRFQKNMKTNLSSLRLKIINKFFISPNCFSPKPKVNSMIIHFQSRKIFNIILKY